MIRDSEKHVELLEYRREKTETDEYSEPFDRLSRLPGSNGWFPRSTIGSRTRLESPGGETISVGDGREEEQHACISFACKVLIESYDDETLHPTISPEKAGESGSRRNSLLAQGMVFLPVGRSLSHVLEIESL